MKIIHTSDWHLGKTIYGKSLIEDQEHFVKNIFFEILEREHPKVVIISGDIFDKTIAPVGAIKLFDSVIETISNMGITLVIITGNHDSSERISVGNRVLRKQNVFIISQYDKSCIALNDEQKKINIYPIPFVAKGIEDIISNISKSLKKDEFNILVSHCFVTGSEVGDGENKIFVGCSQQVSSKIFEDFDFVALGHLHKCQQISKNIFYSGSPLSYSFDDCSQKSITVLDTSKFETNFINIDPLHKMRSIKGSFEKLVDLGKKSPSEDYILAELTDSTPVYMPMTQLRVYFPNILTLRSEWIKLQSEQKYNESILNTKTLTDKEIFFKFMQEVCLEEVSKVDESIFDQTIKEISKENAE